MAMTQKQGLVVVSMAINGFVGFAFWVGTGHWYCGVASFALGTFNLGEYVWLYVRANS